MPAKQSESGGAKAFGGLMAVVALASLTAVIWRPMDQRLASVEVSTKAHLDKADHPIAQTVKIEHIVEHLKALEARIAALEQADKTDKDINARFGLIEEIVKRWAANAERPNA